MFRKDRGSDRPARPEPRSDAAPKLGSGNRAANGPSLARAGTPKKSAGTESKPSQPARNPWPKPTPPGVTPNRLTALLGEPVTRPVNPPPESAPSEPRRETGKRMHIGQDISISGEITTCDVLVVDGHVDAKVRDCGRLEIGPAGTLHGDVEVRNAEIGGHFDGVLNVTDRLTVRGTGRVSGMVRYGRLEVTVGGQLRGDIAPAEEPELDEEERPAQAASEVQPAGLDRPSAASILKPAPQPEPAEAANSEPVQARGGVRAEPKGPAIPTAADTAPGVDETAEDEPVQDAAAKHASPDDTDAADLATEDLATKDLAAAPQPANEPANAEASDGGGDDRAPAPVAATATPERGAVTRLLDQRAAE